MPARFIVLEGPDGSGTTHHSTRLAETLRQEGTDVLHTFEPSDGRIGRMIADNLSEEHTSFSPESLQLLFCADRADHLAMVIEPALQNGTTVICDRYIPSTIVYGSVQGIDRQWLTHMNDGFRSPDLTILLLPPFEVCIERLQRRHESHYFEKESFQRKVYDEYKRYTQEHASVHVVDSGREKEEVYRDILKIVS